MKSIFKAIRSVCRRIQIPFYLRAGDARNEKKATSFFGAAPDLC